MRSPTYVTGEEYCILLIPRPKAEQLNIANSDNVTIRTTENGIAIEKASTGAASTSTAVDGNLKHIQTGNG